MKVIIDTLGGDSKATELAIGAKRALAEISDLSLVLVGREDELREVVSDIEFKDRVEFINATEEITNDDQPTTAIRSKKDSSLVKGLETLANKEDIDALISSGNTGAVLFGGMTKIGRLEGLDRAALAPILPTQVKGKYVCLIDSGANVDCKPEMLAQFAVMGSCYMTSTFGIENPKVALVSVGVEDKKGNEQTKAAFQILKDMPINFVGNMEAREALSGEYDVLVCDGFIGNVLLKSIEGAAKMVLGVTQGALMKNLPENVDPSFLKLAFRDVLALLDFNSNGGAALLGINKIVVKVHGSANQNTIYSAIKQVKGLVDGNLIENTKELIKSSL